MNQIFKSNTVLVLDLDDTLYDEIDYVFSGIQHISELIKKTTGICVINELTAYRKNNIHSDFLHYACECASLPIAAKDSLLWSYRLHEPNIKLRSEIFNWLSICKNEYHALAILTDGRAITQRLKLKALGLLDLPLYISEEWGAEKPNKDRFLAIQERWGKKNYIYIGDNLNKDFITPNELNWTSIGLKRKELHIHNQTVKIPLNIYSPKYWIDDLLDLDSVLNFSN